MNPSRLRRLRELFEVGGEWWARLALSVVSILILGAIGGFRVNVTRSLPIGLYRVVGDAAAVRRGSVVIACLPEEWGRFAVRRRILGPGHCDGNSYGIGKLVLAVEGDVVDLHRESLVINGVSVPSVRTLERDRLGRSIPHFPWGNYELGPAQVWLFSPHPAAFDSRYFGPVSTSRVRSVVQPVWTKKLPIGQQRSDPDAETSRERRY